MYQAENASELLKTKRVGLVSRGSWVRVGRTVFLLGLTSLLTDISSEMVSAILPLYLLVQLRFSPFQVGITDGLYQGVSVLVRMLSGWIADRWRRPKEVAACGYGLSAFCKLGFLAAGSWSSISAVILADRIGKGIRTAPRDAMIAASTPGEQLGTAFGVHRAMDTAGAMLGPLVVVAILTIAPTAYDAIFVVSLCVALIGLAVITFLVENPGPSADSPGVSGAEPLAIGQSAVTLRSMGGLLKISEFRTLVLIGSALALVTVSDGLLYLVLQQRIKVASAQFPLLYVITAMVFMVFAIPAGRLADRIGLKPVFLLGYATAMNVPQARLTLEPRTSLMVGVLMTAAYFMILFALSVAPLAVVAPLRESAIVLVTAWGIWRLRERRGARLRLAGAVAIVVGITLLTIG